jgi:hypothetical protein
MTKSTILSAGALLLLPGLLGAAEITTYLTKVDVKPDGTATAVSELALAGNAGETIDIPLTTLGSANLKLAEGPEGLKLDVPKGKGAPKVTLPPGATSAKLKLSFDVPEGFVKPEEPKAGAKLTMPKESRTVKAGFVNTHAALVKDFDLLVTLPEGWRVQGVKEQLPKLKKTEVEPRVRLAAAGGRQNALLQMMNLKQGDATSMQVEAQPSGRSLLWLLAGIALSAAYLYKFRDLVSGKEA